MRKASELSQNKEIEISDSLQQLRPEVIKLLSKFPLEVQDYVGNAQSVCRNAVQAWVDNSGSHI